MSEIDPSATSAPDLWQLVYASAARPGLAAADLASILGTAREHNAEVNVTGMLLFVEASFLQVLEGEAAALEVLLARIRTDPRHDKVVLLLRDQIQTRAFAEWTMGYTTIAYAELEDTLGVSDFSRPDAFSTLSDSKVRRLLELFRSGSYRQRIS